MSRKHTVFNGASHMEDCAEYIRNLFAAEGYEAQKLTVNDPSQKGMLVQVRNSAGVIKSVTGLSACATLKIMVHGDNLEFEVLGGKWLDKAAVNVVSWFVLWPLFVTSGIGMWRQKKLLDRVYEEAVGYFVREG